MSDRKFAKFECYKAVLDGREIIFCGTFMQPLANSSFNEPAMHEMDLTLTFMGLKHQLRN